MPIKEMPRYGNERNVVPHYLTDWYCPMCGDQECWQPVGEHPDYYNENSMFCTTCGHTQWSMPAFKEREI